MFDSIRAVVTKHCGLVGLYRTAFLAHSAGGWKPRSGAGGIRAGEVLFPGCPGSERAVLPFSRGRRGGGSLGCLLSGHSSHHGAPPSWSNLSPRPHFLIHERLKIFLKMHLKYFFHLQKSWVVYLCSM